MKIEIKYISDLTFTDLFPPCNGCIYWEAPEYFGQDEHGRMKLTEKKAIKLKHDWFMNALGTFGSCGMILYVEGKAAGYAQFAPPRLLPNVAEYSKLMLAPSPDAVLISCLYIRKEYQRQGLGKKLLQSVVENLRKEAIGL